MATKKKATKAAGKPAKKAVKKAATKAVKLAPSAKKKKAAHHADLPAAVRALDVDAVRGFLDRGVHPDAGRHVLGTPLVRACEQLGKAPEAAEIVELLLAHGADPNHRSVIGMTPLLSLAYSGDDAGARAIVDAGGRLDAVSAEGTTVLHAASQGGLSWLMKQCLSAGMNPNDRAENGFSPLHFAVSDPTPRDAPKDRVACARLLLEAGALLHYDNPGWGTALHAAVGDAVAIRFLVAQGAAVAAATRGGEQPIHLAAQYHSPPESLGVLLDLGADPNAATDSGFTPLHFAAWCTADDKVAKIELLLDAGADATARSKAPQGVQSDKFKEGTTAADVARRKRSAPALAVLEKAMKSPRAPSGKKRAPTVGKSAAGKRGAASVGDDDDAIRGALTDGGERVSKDLAKASWQRVRAYRDALLDLEQKGGITEVHGVASRALAKRRALIHDVQHDTSLSALAVSPDGRFLATATSTGDDYEAGGSLVIWDVAVGRAVHALCGIDGGVGWDGYPRQIQWSSDGRYLVLGFATNVVGRYDIFATARPDAFDARHNLGTGADRPYTFGLAPEGDVVAWLALDEEDCRRAIVMWRPGERKIGWLENGAKGAPAIEGICGGSSSAIAWTDDARILVRNDERLHAWDTSTRKLVWSASVEPPVAFSRDGRFIAHHPGRLELLSARTGKAALPALSLETEPSGFVFAPADSGDTPPRLAAIVEGDGIAVFDDGALVCKAGVSPASPDDDFDFSVLAWSPDGESFACLSEDDTLEVWRIRKDGAAEKRWTLALPDMTGVAWPMPSRIVAASTSSLVFVDASTGKAIHERVWLDERAAHSGLADETARGHRVAIDGRWVIFDGDQVVGDEEQMPLLDAYVSWSIDRRVAWPLRWDLPARKQPAAPRRGQGGSADLPPLGSADLRDVLRAAVRAMEALPRMWGERCVRGLARCAEEFARLGDLDEVRKTLAAIDDSELAATCARARCVAVLARAGRSADARALARENATLAQFGADIDLVKTPKSMRLGYSPGWYAAHWASALGEACHALGSAKEGDRWFERAKTSIGVDEPNPGEHLAKVVEAMVSAGLAERAKPLLAKKPETAPNEHRAVRLVVTLARAGAWELVETFLERHWAPWELDAHELVPTLRRFTPPARRAAVASLVGLDVDDLEGEKELHVPTAQDHEELAAIHRELLETPAKRRSSPAHRLWSEAIARRHWAAAIVALEQLDAKDFNARGTHAMELAWGALLGAADLGPTWD